MATFTTAPISEVAPKRATKGPSQRQIIADEFKMALSDAVDKGQALVITLDGDDKALTIRNRLKRAADALGLSDMNIRRKGDSVVAWQTQADVVAQALEVATATSA